MAPARNRWRIRAGLPALAVLLACTPAHAQTAPQESPHAVQARRCLSMAQQSPRDAIALANTMLAGPALPGPVRLQALGCLALAQQTSGQGAQSLATVERLLAGIDGEDVTPVARVNMKLLAGSTLLSNGEGDRALTLMHEALEEARGLNEGTATLNALISIAGLRSGPLDDPAGALPYFEQAIALLGKIERLPTMQVAIVHYNHAYNLLVLGRTAEAEAGFLRARQLVQGQPGQQGMAERINSHRGEILRRQGKLEAAQAILTATRDAQQRNGDTHGLVVTEQRLGQLALDRGDVDTALAAGTQALSLAETGHFDVELRDALELLVAVHAARGEPTEAAAYTRRIQAIQRERERGRTLEQLAQLQARVDRDTAPGGAASQDLSQAQLARNLALGALALALAGGGLVLWRLRRRMRRLAAQSGTDALTGLPNRREAEARITAMANTHPGDEERRCALLLLDLDRFKAINDRHGHAVGDLALAHVSGLLRQACDTADVVVRWGGEEFVVARADSSREAAFALAEHLRASVARVPLALPGGETLDLTVSIGLASHPFFPSGPGQALPADGWKESLRLADRALYVAKRAGRDAWAALWGLPAGRHVDLYSVRQNPESALGQGWVAIGGNRPMSWAPLREGEAGSGEVGAPARTTERRDTRSGRGTH